MKFIAKRKMREVIANIYGRDGDPDVWDRVEHWHEECYVEAGLPYGHPTHQELRVGNFKHVLNQ